MRKLETTVTINKSTKDVWDYMNEPDNMPKWLDNLVRYELVSGNYGETGSIGRQVYLENGREFVMEEEIVDQKKHEFIKLRMTSKQMDMDIENYFKSPKKNVTELTAIAEFTRVSLMMRLMMTFFMSNRKAQAQHEGQMNKLKELVENN